MLELATLAPKIRTFLTDTATQVARATGFVQRRSKLTGARFLQILTLGFLAKPTAALTDLVETASALGVTVTRQGLHHRILAAETFLQAMFAECLAAWRAHWVGEGQVLQQFSAVYITDSTGISLPATLAPDFLGCGGTGSPAALKLQVQLDIVHGTFAGVDLFNGRTPDQAYRGDLHAIQAGALYLSDLGYFVLARFQALADHHAYFLSRLEPHTTLVTAATGQPLDLLAWLSAQPTPLFEETVCLGRHAHLPCRLIGARVPQEVADQRRRRVYATAKRKGRTPSAQRLRLLAWSVFITNVAPTQLTAAQVVHLYALRWQVELLFKLWKSECALDRVAGENRPRVLSELYAKLIGAVLLQLLLAPNPNYARELSPVKALRILRHYLPALVQALAQLDDLQRFLHFLVTRFQANGLKDQRRQRLTPFQRFRALEQPEPLA